MLLILIFSVLSSIGYSFPYGNNYDQEPVSSNDSILLIEKVYLHTDRTYYYPGDDIWFKAYLINAYDRTLSGQSRNLHVELISPSGNIISDRIIRMSGGLGNGDFQLSETLISGKYRIRAYTNYMRNFDDDIFFNKEINIISSTPPAKTTLPSVESKFTDLYFFPEGGSLVEGIESVVAFKAVDERGRGYDVTGIVYSSDEEKVADLRSSHLGMGKFILKPEAGLRYYSIIKNSDNTEVRKELLESYETGVTINASINDGNNIVVTIKTNDRTLSLLKEQDLSLAISARHEVIKALLIRIRSLSNKLIIPTDDLPAGIAMLTLSAPGSLPLAERLIFLPPKDDLKINVQTDKTVYKMRDPVSIGVSLGGDSTNQQNAFLSFSAAESNFSDNITEHPSTIASWFFLESDIRGTVEGPSLYFDPLNPARAEDLDLLLITQGWRDFTWKSDTSNYYSLETGFFVSGRLRRLNIDKPLNDSKVNIVIQNDDQILSEQVPSDKKGRFEMRNIDINGRAQLVVSGIDKTGLPNGMVVLDSTRYIPPDITEFESNPGFFKTDTVTPLNQAAGLEEKEMILVKEYNSRTEIRKKYKLTDTIGLPEVAITAVKSRDVQEVRIETVRSIYGGEPDNEVVVTTSMEKTVTQAPELLMGTVAGVYVTGPVRGQYSIRFARSMAFGGMSSNAPILLVDGIKRPLEYFNIMPVGMIDRIDILKTIGKTAAYGIEGSNGVISVITRTGDRMDEKKEVAESTSSTILSGYDMPRVFYSPKHNTSSPSYVPDLRTTLYWNPDINLSAGEDVLLDYYNSDSASRIRVTVEGITSSGIPLYKTVEYEVEK